MVGWVDRWFNSCSTNLRVSPNLSQIGPNGSNLGLFKISFHTLPRLAKMYWNLILKSPIFIGTFDLNWPNLGPTLKSLPHSNQFRDCCWRQLELSLFYLCLLTIPQQSPNVISLGLSWEHTHQQGNDTLSITQNLEPPFWVLEYSEYYSELRTAFLGTRYSTPSIFL